MKMQLMPNYLGIKVEDTSKTKSGIVLAETAEKEKPSRGIIVNIGEQDSDFKIGQEILFEKYASVEIEVDKEVIHLIDKRDVLLTLE